LQRAAASASVGAGDSAARIVSSRQSVASAVIGYRRWLDDHKVSGHLGHLAIITMMGHHLHFVVLYRMMS